MLKRRNRNNNNNNNVEKSINNIKHATSVLCSLPADNLQPHNAYAFISLLFNGRLVICTFFFIFAAAVAAAAFSLCVKLCMYAALDACGPMMCVKCQSKAKRKHSESNALGQCRETARDTTEKWKN